MIVSDWKTYYSKHRSRPVRPLVDRAVSLCADKNAALDLGAGTLVESVFLLGSGFKNVTAVDSSPQLVEFAKELNNNNLKAVVSSFKHFAFVPDTYDFITAQYALPFYGPEDFNDFFAKVASSLKKGGVFTGQLFGERDGWNTPNSNLAFHTKTEVEALLQELDIKELEEEEREGLTAAGDQKHWHVFHFIAVK